MNQPILTMELEPLLTGGIIIVNAIAVLALIFYVLYQKRYYLRRQEKEKLDASFREELLRVQLEIQSQAMKNASHKFHDIIGQEMSLVKLNLSTTDAANPAETENKIEFSKNLLGKAIQNLRNLSKNLHADSIIGAGLYNAIQLELEKIHQEGNIQTHLFMKPDLPEPDTRRGLILFRIVQEFLQNITRQTSAKHIQVYILVHNDKLMLSISDDRKESEQETDVGIIQKRAGLINAVLEIENMNGKGNKVSIFLPFENQNLIV